MNSRERVLAVLNHQRPDRLPIDMGGNAATALSVEAYAKLRRGLGLPEKRIRVWDLFGMMAEIDPEVVERFEADILLVHPLCPRFDIPIDAWKPWRLPDGTPVEVPLGMELADAEDGGLLLMVEGEAVGKMPKGGFYFSELANATMGGIEALVEPPDPDHEHFPLLTDEDLRFRQENAQRLYETTDKALVVELMDNIRWNTSVPNWFYALGVAPERAAALHQKKSQNLLAKVQQLHQAVGPYVQVFAIYHDLGTQRGEALSPDSFARLVAPHYRTVFDWIHQHTDWKVFYHTCGSVYRLIPHLIGMGVDILNPLQANAARMEPERLKADFGQRLVFWGGGIDTQSVLPFGTREEVRQQVRQRIAAFGGDGTGYIFGPSQDVQADVPAENLIAMYDEARRFGRYPLP